MNQTEQFEIESRLIEANNLGFDADTSITHAANSVHVTESRAREVYDFLFNLQERLEKKLSIAI
jgi:hypothetical protein